MGIVNAGPDSFSDIGAAPTTKSCVELGLRLIDEGAAIIDVGGESGVTYTPETDVAEELARIEPVVAELVAAGAVVSIDSYKPAVVAAALEAGAHLVNDVSGLRDRAVAEFAGSAGAGLVVMHTRAEPKTVHFPQYEDVVEDVIEFLVDRREQAIDHGVDARGLLLDPGPDFAKTPAETIAVLRAADRMTELGTPWLAAVSRKYFQAAIVPRPPTHRRAMTLAAVAHVADHGAAVVRVHDVAATADFLAARAVLSGRAEPLPVDADDERLKWVRSEQAEQSAGPAS
jgi:dihydropteroate synthase